MKVLGNINVDLDVVNKEYVDGEIKNIDVSGQLVDYAKKDHTHSISDITNLQTTLNSKADANGTDRLERVVALKAEKDHKHSIADINNLQTALDGKAPKDHTHSDYATMEYVSTLNDIILKTVTGLSGKSDLDHKHSISDITNLQTELNSKAGVSHTHSEYLKKGDPIQLTSAQKAELKGERGAPGTPGKDGQNGMITYIRYANNPSGDNMTSSPQSDTTHIGIYTYEGRNAPPSSVYQWTRIKGDPGESINTWTGTQAEYDRIYRKSPTTLYIITG